MKYRWLSCCCVSGNLIQVAISLFRSLYYYNIFFNYILFWRRVEFYLS